MRQGEFLIQNRQLPRQDRTSAIADLEQSLQSSESDKNSRSSFPIFLDLAVELMATKQQDAIYRAKSLAHQAKELLEQDFTSSPAQDSLFDQENLAYLLYVQAILSVSTNEMSTALDQLQGAYNIYTDINHAEGQSLIDDTLGQYHLYHYNSQLALSHFERSLSLRLEREEREIALSYLHLGCLYLFINDLEQSASLFNSALEMAIANDDEYLRRQALKGLIKIAIARHEWTEVIAMLKDTIGLLSEPTDAIEIGYLYCDLAEALLGNNQVEESLICVRIQVLPRFRDFQHSQGVAIAKHLRGRIYVQRLAVGLDALDEDAIETAEDSLIDASIAFEQFGMMLEYARSLYDLALLYQLCSNSQFQYQYQGKSLRSLELAFSILDQIGFGDSELATKVDTLLDQVMRKG
ncbi:MAG: hypothetical protein DCE90_15895 [Pseudanabaena sp.]|nr:MAG: hypothetical protein DCE90_15895 [Pseudanabaena sp.]